MYAEKTSVAREKSQVEIRKILSKYKATGFAIGENNNKAVVMFEMKDRRIRFIFDLPIKGKWKTRNKGWNARDKEIEQEVRRLWRCMVICIKSKLECVESGITTFEQEFLAHTVLPNGQTMSEYALPLIEKSYQEKEMQPMLGYNG